jgi:hypothetical protein
MSYELQAVRSPEDWRHLHKIRRAVLFVPERHSVPYDEIRMIEPMAMCHSFCASMGTPLDFRRSHEVNDRRCHAASFHGALTSFNPG